MLPNPNVPNFDVGINAVVNILRPYLLNVLYNYEDADCNIQTLPFYESEQIFGIAEKDELTKNPIIKKGKNDYHNLLPNDQKKTVAFFYEHDPRKVEKNLTTFDLSLVVWFNHNLLIPNVFPNVQYTEVFIDKTINELNKIVDWRESSYQIFKGKDNIYTDFDLKDRAKPIMKYPYDGFRIRFKFSTRIFCKYDLPIFNCSEYPVI